ncbi:ADP-forming succinate--CoA ligase subunit beta [Chloroflexota bacterium]
MKLFEFEAKSILQKYGIAVPKGEVATTAEQAEKVAKDIGKPVAVKSQILVSGRGKAGGIKLVENEAKAKETASQLLGSSIKGIKVGSVLIEEKLDIKEQLYVSITVDRQAKKYVVLGSTAGGVDIEEVAKSTPEKISRHWVDPVKGLTRQDIDGLVSRLNMNKPDTDKLALVIEILYKALLEYDAELVELNPLVKVASGDFVAADARIIIDDNALFRHPEFADRSKQSEEYTEREIEGRAKGLAYVDLDGDIGIIGNGAGLVMATLDLVQVFGGKPANFLDIGGGARPEVIRDGVLLVMSKPGVKAVLINILGGITRCDLVAQGVIEGLKVAPVKKPIAVRMMGTNEKEGEEMLKQAGIYTYPDMEKAAEAILKA